MSCRRNGIDPWEYVRDVLRRLPAMKYPEVPSLLPRCWKPSQQAAG
ncbi:MAG TPA: transposase domain-containing protein [Verrucomicrobiae bacterium]